MQISSLKDIQEALANTIQDADPEARKTSKECFFVLQRAFPDYAHELLSHLPQSVQKSLSTGGSSPMKDRRPSHSGGLFTSTLNDF